MPLRALRPLPVAAFLVASVGACALLTDGPQAPDEVGIPSGGVRAEIRAAARPAAHLAELERFEREAPPARLPVDPEQPSTEPHGGAREPRLPWTTAQMDAATRGEAIDGRRFAVTRRSGGYALDPVEPGETELTLVLHDGATGEPVTSLVELWRLDAPENDYFGQGDQHARDLRVEGGVLSVPQLAEGRYRIVVHAARPVEDLMAFPVLGARHRAQFLVQLPRRRPVLLALYDTHGASVQEAQRRAAHPQNRARSVPAPAWEERRKMKIYPAILRIGGGGGGRFGGRIHWRDMKPGARGFDLGHLVESSRDCRRGLDVSVRTTGSAILRCEVSGDPVEGDDGGSIRMVGVAVDQGEVLGNIFLPDGRTATGIQAEVEIRATALRDTHDDPKLWRRVPVTVKVDHPEYEPLLLEYEAGEGFEAQYLGDRIL